MGWRTFCFGTSTPSTGVVVGYSCLMLNLLFCVYGMYNDFFPSRWTIRIGGLLAATITIALLAAQVSYNLSGRNPNFRRSPWTMLWAMPLGFLFLGGLSWIAVSHGIAGGYTLVFGTGFTTTSIFVTDRAHSRRSCDYRIEGEMFSSGFPDYVCISRAFYESHPDTRVEMRVVGKESFFGRAVTGIHHVHVADAENAEASFDLTR